MRATSMRQEERFRVNFSVRFGIARDFVQEYAENLSSGGLFIRGAHRLAPGERAWLSTEILESLFGRYKRLEGQHSKGGFTSLLASLPVLCGQMDGPNVRKRLLEIDNKQLKQWVQTTIGGTLTARRVAAYNEFKLATHG